MAGHVISNHELAQEMVRDIESLLSTGEFDHSIRVLRGGSVVLRNYSTLGREEVLRRVKKDRLEAIAFTLYNAGITDTLSKADRDRYLTLAGEIFERLHLLYSADSKRRQRLILASALSYALSGYTANCTVLLRHLNLDRLTPLETVAVLYLRGALSTADEQCKANIILAREREQEFVNHLAENNAADSLVAIWSTIAELRAYQGIQAAVAYFMTDSPEQMNRAQQCLKRAEDVCLENGLVDTWLICSGIRSTFVGAQIFCPQPAQLN